MPRKAPPPNNIGVQAVALREAAMAFAEHAKTPGWTEHDYKGQRLNRDLLMAAIDYAVTVSGPIERIVREKAVTDAAIRWYKRGRTSDLQNALMRTVEASIGEVYDSFGKKMA